VRRGLLLAIYLGGFALIGLLLRGGSPVIEEIAVEGGERISASIVYTQSGLRVGDVWNASVRERALEVLAHLPGVKGVALKAEPRPGGRVRVHILVEEREPYGIIKLEGRGLFWVDREGFLLDPLEGEAYLPVVSGVKTHATPRGERIASQEAIRVLREFYSLAGRRLGRFLELHIREYDLELITREGRRLLLPKEGLKAHLAQLEGVLLALKEKNWRTLDLRFEGEVVLGW